jgi:uncharacterized repeat protein (TIGR02543 family)
VLHDINVYYELDLPAPEFDYPVQGGPVKLLNQAVYQGLNSGSRFGALQYKTSKDGNNWGEWQNYTAGMNFGFTEVTYIQLRTSGNGDWFESRPSPVSIFNPNFTYIEYAVNFEIGHNLDLNPPPVTYVERGSLILPTAVRSGYIFDGWFTAPAGGTRAGGTGGSFFPPEPFGSLTLYAQWTADIQTGTTYYFSASAPSAGNGTLASPYKDITILNTLNLSAGDTALLEYGSVWTNTNIQPDNNSYYIKLNKSGTGSSPIKFDAYGDSSKPKPVINGSGTHNAVFIESVSYVEIKNIHVKNNSVTDGITEKNRRGLFIGSWNGLARGVHLTDIEVSEVHGWGWHGNNTSGGNWWSSAAIELNGEGFVDFRLEDSYIYDIGCYGIRSVGTTINCVIRNNIIRNTGMDIINAGSMLHEYNGFYDCSRYEYTPGENRERWSGTAYGDKGGIFQYNEFAGAKYDGDSQSINWDQGSTGTSLFQYNYSHDNEGGFFMMWPGGGNGEGRPNMSAVIVRYNISVNDGNTTANRKQPKIGGSRYTFKMGDGNALIYNNTIMQNNGDNVQIASWQRDGKSSYFYNNIFYVSDLASSRNSVIGLVGTQNNNGNPLVFENNAYFGNSTIGIADSGAFTENPLFVGTDGSGILPAVTETPNLTTYQIGLALAELCAPYRISAKSPLAGMGIPVTKELALSLLPKMDANLFDYNNGYDFFGNVLPNDRDLSIGAHEPAGTE